MYIYIYMYTYVYMHMYMYIYLLMYLSIYIYLYTFICIHIHICPSHTHKNSIPVGTVVEQNAKDARAIVAGRHQDVGISVGIQHTIVDLSHRLETPQVVHNGHEFGFLHLEHKLYTQNPQSVFQNLWT